MSQIANQATNNNNNNQSTNNQNQTDQQRPRQNQNQSQSQNQTATNNLSSEANNKQTQLAGAQASHQAQHQQLNAAQLQQTSPGSANRSHQTGDGSQQHLSTNQHQNPSESKTQNGIQLGGETNTTTNNPNSNSNSSKLPGGLTNANASAAMANVKKELPANGKKTKGRVRIKMEFIHNKLRRYTTFSKRKTGIMKKVSAYRFADTWRASGSSAWVSRTSGLEAAEGDEEKERER